MSEDNEAQDVMTDMNEHRRKIEARVEDKIKDVLQAHNCVLIPIIEFGPNMTTRLRVQFNGCPCASSGGAMTDEDATSTGPRESKLIRGISSALIGPQTKTAQALLQLAESNKHSRQNEARMREIEHRLWGEVRDDLRGLHTEIQELGDRMVQALEKQPAHPAPPASEPGNNISIPKTWLPWILVALFGGDAAPELIARFIGVQASVPVVAAPVENEP